MRQSLGHSRSFEYGLKSYYVLRNKSTGTFQKNSWILQQVQDGTFIRILQKFRWYVYFKGYVLVLRISIQFHSKKMQCKPLKIHTTTRPNCLNVNEFSLATKNCHKKGTFKTKIHGLPGGTIISGGTFFKKNFLVWQVVRLFQGVRF